MSTNQNTNKQEVSIDNPLRSALLSGLPQTDPILHTLLSSFHHASKYIQEERKDPNHRQPALNLLTTTPVNVIKATVRMTPLVDIKDLTLFVLMWRDIRLSSTVLLGHIVLSKSNLKLLSSFE
jgi:hypothetical protein